MSDSLSKPFVERMVSSGRMPGAVWWVENPSGVATRGVAGYAVLEPKRVPLTFDTPFDLASLTKPLCTALLLVLLESEGILDPAAPIGDSVEEVRGAFFADSTLLELARHTAGFAPWRPLYLGATDRSGYLEQLSREVAAVARGETLYSDLGYILLGIAIERCTGETLDRLFRRHVGEPLQLERTGFGSTAGEFDDAAATERGNAYERLLAGSAGRDHVWRRAVIRGQVHDGNAFGLGGTAGHAGLFGTVSEVARVVREILRPRQLGLTARGRARLLEARDGVAGRTVGLVTASAARAATGILPAAAPGHTGFTGTSLWLDPVGDAFFLLLTNRVHPEVTGIDFDRVRRGFHRAATRDVRGGDRG